MDHGLQSHVGRSPVPPQARDCRACQGPGRGSAPTPRLALTPSRAGKYREGMSRYVYREMGHDEEALDWAITKAVMSDSVLMKTLEDSQSGGEKHAVVAIVESGALKEAYVSPERAVEETFPFDAVRRAFASYTTHGGVCLVIVRGNAVAVSLNGIVGKN
jgi:hypothetical protein